MLDGVLQTTAALRRASADYAGADEAWHTDKDLGFPLGPADGGHPTDRGDSKGMNTCVCECPRDASDTSFGHDAADRSEGCVAMGMGGETYGTVGNGMDRNSVCGDESLRDEGLQEHASDGHGETDFHKRSADGMAEVLGSQACVESASHEKWAKMWDMLQVSQLSQQATRDMMASMLEEQRERVNRTVETNRLLLDVVSIGEICFPETCR